MTPPNHDGRSLLRSSSPVLWPWLWLSALLAGAAVQFAPAPLLAIVALAALATLALNHAAREQMRAARHAAQAETDLRAAQQRLEFAICGVGSAAWELSLADGAVWASPGFAEALGFTHGGPSSGSDWFEDRVHPEDREAWRECMLVLSGAPASRELELRLMLPSGEHRWFRLRVSSEGDGHGRSVRIHTLLTDVSE
ncbi:PAS domain-containing protein, partial [Hyphomicrobium sp.]|uniref:PAS domain-containing protein n=1 Tax=Hyphomicrobium sp. TaxID=82 RepID=UPI0025BA1A89